jgi:hypothetical protein
MESRGFGRKIELHKPHHRLHLYHHRDYPWLLSRAKSASVLGVVRVRLRGKISLNRWQEVVVIRTQSLTYLVELVAATD